MSALEAALARAVSRATDGASRASLGLAQARAAAAARIPRWIRRLFARVARTRGARHARARAALFGVALTAGTCAVARRESPAPRSEAGVAAMLGRTAGCDVAPAGYVWQRSGGALADYVIGRHLVFVGAEPGKVGDVFRARVRVTPSGRALGVRELRRLTSSARGDERDLVARDDRVAWATFEAGRARSITVLDFSNDEARRAAASRPLLSRLASRLERFFSVGGDLGFAETDVRLEAGAASVRFELQRDGLVLAASAASAGGAGGAGGAAPRDGDALVAHVPLPAGPTTRAVGASGTIGEIAVRWIPADERAPGPVRERLLVRALGDHVARAALAASARVEALDARGRRATGDGSASRPAAGPDGAFPPPLEGAAWAPFARLAGAKEGADGARVDRVEAEVVRVARRASGGAAVTLVAIDARRVRFGVQAGLTDGVATSGARGSGAVPARAIFAFNAGAPRAADRAGAIPVGLIAAGALVDPLLAGAPTVALCPTPLGPRLGFGELGPAGCGGGEPLALVQSAPRAAHACPECALARTALCATRGGQVVYAWSPAARASELDAALQSADCDRTHLLGTGEAATGFAWLGPPTAGPSPPALRAAPTAADPAMPLEGADFPARGAFFTVELVDPRPTLGLPRGAAWASDGLVQPPPAELPAVYKAEFSAAGVPVTVHALAPGRFAFRVEPGADEMRPRVEGFGGRAAAAARPLVVIGLGTATAKRKAGPAGLALGGVPGLPVHDHAAALILERPDAPSASAVRVERSDGLAVPPGADVAELELAAEGGRMVAAVRKVGRSRDRGAICVLEGGTVLTATAHFDSDEPTTQALLDLGCTRVASLDRGAEVDVGVRAATPDAPVELRQAVTTLVAFEAPLARFAGTL